MKLRYTPLAMEDLDEIRSYIRRVLCNPTAAKRIGLDILDACGKLRQFPLLGFSLAEKAGVDSDLRCLFVGNYAAVYRIEGETVSVARILDARSDYLSRLQGE